MASGPGLPEVHLSAAVVVHRGRILVHWNEQWGCYSLPMSKIRARPDHTGLLDQESETPRDAAIRAAAEVLQRPLYPSECSSGPEQLDLQPYSHRSHRDGLWKRYQREVFVIRLDEAHNDERIEKLLWLSVEELRSCQPISPTLLDVVNMLDASGFRW